MSDFINIPIGYKITSQIPLNPKEYSASELQLKDLGLNNNLAFTYEQGLIVYCIQEGTRWEWKEALEPGGLLPVNFTYPPNTITFGIDYSNKSYNFYPTTIVTLEPPFEKITEGVNTGIVVRGRDAAQYGNIGYDALDITSAELGAQGDTWGQVGQIGVNPTQTYGILGDNSFGYGFNVSNQAWGAITGGIYNHITTRGDLTAIFGRNTYVDAINSFASGSYNKINYTSLGHKVVFGNGNDVFGGASFTAGVALINKSVGTTVVGTANLDYTNTQQTLNVADAPLFIVGNGSIATPNGIWNATTRSDAFKVLRNGLIFAPSVTNALITADATGKSLITKEYLVANSIVVPDATTTVKGILKLTNDLGGTADLPTTPTALHKTGNESFTGQKGFINLNATPTVISGTQSATNGNLIRLVTGTINAGGELLKISSTSADSVTNIAKLLVLDAGSLSVGMPFTIQNNGVDTCTITKTGNITSNSFIKSGGTSIQRLMADGSVTEDNNQKVISTNYTLLSIDNNYTIFIDNGASNITITVPAGLVDKFNCGFIQRGTGTVTFAASGSTIFTPIGLKIKGQYYNAYIEKDGATNNYYLLGNLIV